MDYVNQTTTFTSTDNEYLAQMDEKTLFTSYFIIKKQEFIFWGKSN